MARITLDHVHAALSLSPFDVEAARQRMTPRPRTRGRPLDRPGQARLAAVLVLLFPVSGELGVVLMRRANHPHDAHSGQVSFPGGRREGDESLVETALREAGEEVGVEPGAVQVIGGLAHLYTPSDFDIHPIVGYTPAHPLWKPDAAEVARVIELPLPTLLDETIKVEEEWDLGGFKLRVPFYRVDGETVWGATAMMLAEFEGRLRAVLGA